MATRKKNRKTRKTRRTSTASTNIALAEANAGGALEMKGEKLVVKISRESHPDVFEIDRLIKQIQKVRQDNAKNRRLRDLCEFLEETEKSLQIILSNHLEDALRTYLG